MRWNLEITKITWNDSQKEFERISWVKWRVKVSTNGTSKVRSYDLKVAVWSIICSKRNRNVIV